MKKTKTVLLAFAATIGLGGGSAFYCYGPILPELVARLNLRWDARRSYYRGWMDASFERMRGQVSYSFHNYIVDGIATYAREVDGIAAPPDREIGSLYLAGFNERMTGAIRRRVGSDFPHGYVRRFLDRGWLDFTTDQPVVCPVHNHGLDVAVVPFELVYPLTMARPKFDWEIAGEASFPFPGSTKKVDASWVSRPRNARIRVCPACSKAEGEWWASRKAPNKAPEPTPTAVTSPAAQEPRQP